MSRAFDDYRSYFLLQRTNEFLKLAAFDENISVVSTETFYNDPLEALQRLKVLIGLYKCDSDNTPLPRKLVCV